MLTDCGRELVLDELTRHAIAAWLAETCEPCIMGTRLRGMHRFCRWDLPDLVGFLMAIGLRIGEACGLPWNAVDLQAGTVEVRAAAVRVRGQGLVVKTTKTDAGTRTLVLPRWCTAMLRERAACLNPDRGYRSHPVFPALLGGCRDPSNTQADLREAFTAADFDWVTSHTFRKTVATLMDQAGLPSRAAADQLGHAHTSVTTDVYFGRRVATPAPPAYS